MPPLIKTCYSNRRRPRQPLAGVVALLFLAAIQPTHGQAIQSSLTTQVLTNIYEIWEMPRQFRAEPHRMRTEFTVYFFDSEWNNAWGECQGRPAWLPIADSPTPLKAGQRVAIDGVIVP